MTDNVDFSGLTTDLFELAGSRRLTQFIKSCVMADVIEAEVEQAQDLDSAVISTMQLRTINDARGVQLDVIGQIVGQERVLKNQAEIDYFTWDDDPKNMDNAVAFAEGAPLAGDLPADDLEYRQLIISKIFKNHVQGGTIPEILNFVKILYGINISIRKNGDTDITLVLPLSAPDSVVITLQSEINDVTADHQFFLPLPTGTRITSVIQI